MNKPATNFAYCAGLIDGEGCISIVKGISRLSRRPSTEYSLRVFVSMNSLECIKKLQGIFGGGLYMRERENTNFQSFNWTVTSNTALEVLKKTLPYLHEKKQQAILGIEFQNMLNRRKKLKHSSRLSLDEVNEREKFFKRMKSLKTEKLIPIASKGLP